jgi:hypothetical protein
MLFVTIRIRVALQTAALDSHFALADNKYRATCPFLFSTFLQCEDAHMGTQAAVTTGSTAARSLGKQTARTSTATGGQKKLQHYSTLSKKYQQMVDSHIAGVTIRRHGITDEIMQIYALSPGEVRSEVWVDVHSRCIVEAQNYLAKALIRHRGDAVLKAKKTTS